MADDSSIWDIVIIGAGLAGCAFVWALRQSGLRILILERGSYLPQEAENWDPEAVIQAGRYEPNDEWLSGQNERFRPRVYYNVGGSSKFFGGSAFRLRKEDFMRKDYPDGSTPEWPVSYVEMAPWYDIAERQMRVHGERYADPTDPAESGAPEYPFPPLEDEPPIAWLRSQLKKQGLTPFPLPIAVHQGGGGHCQKGSPCDGFPCKVRAKGDGENAFLRPALSEIRRAGTASIQVETEAKVVRINCLDVGEKVDSVTYEKDGHTIEVSCKAVILAAGAVNSAALLLQSNCELHPTGIGNKNGLVGRNFMAHNNTVLMAINIFRKNPTRFQKTLSLNDWYFYLPKADSRAPEEPRGNIQMRGKVLEENLKKSSFWWRRTFRRWIAAHSFDFWVMSEDLPKLDNRVTIAEDGTIRLARTMNNMKVHKDLVAQFKRVLRCCGFHIILEREPDPRTIQHQVGTIPFGTDPKTSVLDPWCRVHGMSNIYVVDGSVFPSSAAVNPALTIAANALRVGDHVLNNIVAREDV